MEILNKYKLNSFYLQDTEGFEPTPTIKDIPFSLITKIPKI